MKTLRSLITLGFVSGLFLAVTDSAFAQSSFTDITVSNEATIGNAISFGQVQLGSSNTAHGARLHVTQQQQEVWHSSTTDGYFQSQDVIVDEYGPIWVPGYSENSYTWDVVSYTHFDAVLDENGVELSAAYDEPVYGWVVTSTSWIDGYWTTGVTGSHVENQQVWVPDSTVSYSEWVYNAPVIHSTATRSDANWVWDVPGEGGSSRTVMRVWDGGLALAEPSGAINMTLSPSSLQYTVANQVPDAASSNTHAVHSATSSQWVTSSVYFSTDTRQDKAELRSDLIRFSRDEYALGINLSRHTQISSDSASFGGVVEVTGDLKVQGVLRVQPAGDVPMSEEFSKGPRP